jgi:glycosyltransferase involved in cell wall biosynthesis
MDYWANIDAVSWFAREVLPGLRRRLPEVCFAIVGARPDGQVQRLAQLPGVIVTGAVPDVRPYLAHARLAVAPLRIARGIQNKVLEALAMGRPLLATPAALAGVELGANLPVWHAETAADMIEAACTALDAISASPDGLRARDWVAARYGWEAHLDRYMQLVQGAVPGAMTLPDTAEPVSGIYAGNTHD